MLPLLPSAALACAVCLLPPPPTWHPGLQMQQRGQPDENGHTTPPGAESDGASSSARDDEADPRTAAETAFAAGEAAYGDENYTVAIEEFEQAQALLPHPFTEYNLGLALARGGRELDAWRVFTVLHEHATSAEQQADVERQLAELSPRVARLRVDAPSGHTVTIEGDPVAPGEELVFTPGPIELHAGDYRKSLELRGGELRHIDLRSLDGPPVPPKPHQRALTGVLATAAVFGAGATGAMVASGFLPPGDRRPWVMTSAGLGGATVALTLTALGLHLRSRRAATRR